MSYFSKDRILKVRQNILLFGLDIKSDDLWIAIFFGKYGWVLYGSGDGK